MSKTFNPDALSEFARYYGFHYDRIDPMALVEDVVYEMDRGLNGDTSSLPMIPAYISPVSKITPGKTVIALDAGGTNLRSALVKFDENGKAAAVTTLKAHMPGTRGRLDPDAFFDEIAAVTAPLIEEAGEKIEGIGFCFSYPMEITKEADGILMTFSKEVDAPSVIGKPVARGLRDALARRNTNAPERIVMLNDTVAALLSGLSELPAYGGLCQGEDNYGTKAGPVVGLILGTGFNTAYPEQKIPKINFASIENPQIVVCETGNFAHRYMGLLDKEFDNNTKNPGVYTLEKAVSGAYIGPLTFHIFCRAIRDGVISFNRADEFLSLPPLQTKDINKFLLEGLSSKGIAGELFGKDERDAIAGLVYLASIITGRAGLLSAAAVAAAVEKAGAGYDPFVPVRIAVEGTTYVVYRGMRSALESQLNVILNKNKPRSYIISPVDQASLFGAAVAALSG